MKVYVIYVSQYKYPFHDLLAIEAYLLITNRHFIYVYMYYVNVSTFKHCDQNQIVIHKGVD